MGRRARPSAAAVHRASRSARGRASPGFNPFPGLRPFEPDEEHLFFGREKEIDELLRRLRTTRFLAVVGTSGSGKSSLVRSGLIPSLHSGFMVRRRLELAHGDDAARRGSDRPPRRGARRARRARRRRTASSPPPTACCSKRRCAAARAAWSTPSARRDLALGRQRPRRRRSVRGAVPLPPQPRRSRTSRDEAVAFVKLLLEATAQAERADLRRRSPCGPISSATAWNIPGLPEAVNDGQYLVAAHDARRAALGDHRSGRGGRRDDRAAAGHAPAERLGDDQDQLPLAAARADAHLGLLGTPTARRRAPIDIEDYESGRHHAERAVACTPRRRIRTPWPSGAWRPRGARVQGADRHVHRSARRAAADVGRASWPRLRDASEAEVDRSRRDLPAAGPQLPDAPVAVPLTPPIDRRSVARKPDAVLDPADRVGGGGARVRGVLLAAVAGGAWYEEGTAGLWRDPELELGSRWRAPERPDRRVGAPLRRRLRAGDRVSRSGASRNAIDSDAEREHERRAKLRRTQLVAGVLATMLVVAVGLGMSAWSERQRAQGNLGCRAPGGGRVARGHRP